MRHCYDQRVTAESPDLPPGRIAFLLAQLGAAAAGAFAGRLDAAGAGSPASAGLLRLIGREPGRSQQEIAAELGTAPSRLVTLVDELEAAGLVQRRRNTRDRRQYELHLTDAGAQRLREIGTISREHGAALLAPLTPAEQRQLGALLTRLATAHGLTPGVHPGYRKLPDPPHHP